MAIEFFKSLLEQATATGTKSTVLTDLRWFTAIVCTALLGALKYNAPAWVLVFMVSLLAIGALLYLAAYIYFAIHSPEFLRTEKYALTKMAIERSITGDNISGLIDPKKSPKQLQPSVTQKEGE